MDLDDLAREREPTPGARPATNKSSSDMQYVSSDGFTVTVRIDRAFWERCLHEKPLSNATMIEELGLTQFAHRIGERDSFAFDNRYVAELGLEISAAAAALEQLSGQELVDAACDEECLAEEVEVLVGVFGEEIWGRNRDRSRLCRDLVFEREEDQELLKQRLRQWIFLEAFGKLREGGVDDDEKFKGRPTMDSETTRAVSQRKPRSTATRRGATRFSLDKIWDEATWTLVLQPGRVSINDVMVALDVVLPGSNLKLTAGRKNLDDKTFKDLRKRISNIARDVWERGLAVEELVKAAANPDYLNKEIDELLYDMGPEIWGMQLQPQRRLVLEEDDDRQMIWLHLHQWIFMKVCNIREAARRAALRKSTTAAEPSEQASTSGNQDESAHSSVELKGHGEVASILRQYFLPNGPISDERALLSRLSDEWAKCSTHYATIFPLDFHASLSAFHSWIEWRAAVVRVREYLESGALPPQPERAQAQCEALLKDMQERRAEFWDAVRVGHGDGVQQMTVEDVICEVVTKILWPDADGIDW